MEKFGEGRDFVGKAKFQVLIQLVIVCRGVAFSKVWKDILWNSSQGGDFFFKFIYLFIIISVCVGVSSIPS